MSVGRLLHVWVVVTSKHAWMHVCDVASVVVHVGCIYANKFVKKFIPHLAQVAGSTFIF